MDKALGYLGLAARAGRLVIGAEDCAGRLKMGGAGTLIAAADAGRNTIEQARRLAAGQKQSVFVCGYTKQELADAIGRGSPVALVMICDEGLAAAFRKAAGAGHGNEEERE